MPRQKFIPTESQRASVQAMLGYGIRHEDIIKTVIGPSGKPISRPTFYRAFKDLTEVAAVQVNSQVAQSLFQQAVGRRERVLVDEDGNETVLQEAVEPSVAAGIWWEKSRCGRSERVRVSGDADGPPILIANAHERIASRIAGIAARIAPPEDSEDAETG